jgi:hypothetical protein
MDRNTSRRLYEELKNKNDPDRAELEAWFREYDRWTVKDLGTFQYDRLREWSFRHWLGIGGTGSGGSATKRHKQDLPNSLLMSGLPKYDRSARDAFWTKYYQAAEKGKLALLWFIIKHLTLLAALLLGWYCLEYLRTF